MDDIPDPVVEASCVTLCVDNPSPRMGDVAFNGVVAGEGIGMPVTSQAAARTQVKMILEATIILELQCKQAEIRVSS